MERSMSNVGSDCAMVLQTIRALNRLMSPCYNVDGRSPHSGLFRGNNVGRERRV